MVRQLRARRPRPGAALRARGRARGQMLLSMHGIIRPDPTTLAQQALAQVRPGLRSHGGDVELDRIADGVAYVRLHGACNGCSMASVTMRDSVEALRTGVPGLTAVEVLPQEPAPVDPGGQPQRPSRRAGGP
ncbi:MAG: NifU family protein [Nocardioides sp.]